MISDDKFRAVTGHTKEEIQVDTIDGWTIRAASIVGVLANRETEYFDPNSTVEELIEMIEHVDAVIAGLFLRMPTEVMIAAADYALQNAQQINTEDSVVSEEVSKVDEEWKRFNEN